MTDYEARREALGKTVREIADEANLREDTVRRAMSGGRISPVTRFKIATLLGISPEEEFPVEESMTIGKWIRLWRYRRGLTLQEAEEKTGLSIGSIVQIESGRGFNIWTAIQMADGYGLSLDELIGRTAWER